jgi:endonuclease YncB( thermonuclease family)
MREALRRRANMWTMRAGETLMRKTGVTAALLALALCGCGEDQTTAHAQAGNGIVGVASVVDGDTIEIHGARIRLSGFDTPERGARCGGVNVHQRAANELSAFIAGRTVSCTPGGTDAHGRTVATCNAGGTDLGEHMVGQGWGRDWPRYSGGAYADEETAARAARRGMWGLSCPADLWGGRGYD